MANQLNHLCVKLVADGEDIDLPPVGNRLVGEQIEAGPGNNSQQTKSDEPDVHDESLSHDV